MEIRADGKVALVTGGSSGIGLATAERLAADGARVALAARGGPALKREAERLKRTYGVDTLAVEADMGRAEDVARLIQTCVSAFGKIDILVNGGADVPSSHPLEAVDSDWETGIAVKLMGYVRCSREAARVMRESGGGAIVLISSISGREGLGASGVPGAVNSAVLNLNKTMANELAPHRIRVNAVNPGFTDTPRMDRHTAAMARDLGMTQAELQRQILATIPLRRFGQATDMANMIAFLVSDQASYITGAVFTVDGGWSRSVF